MYFGISIKANQGSKFLEIHTINEQADLRFSWPHITKRFFSLFVLFFFYHDVYFRKHAIHKLFGLKIIIKKNLFLNRFFLVWNINLLPSVKLNIPASLMFNHSYHPKCICPTSVGGGLSLEMLRHRNCVINLVCEPSCISHCIQQNISLNRIAWTC